MAWVITSNNSSNLGLWEEVVDATLDLANIMLSTGSEEAAVRASGSNLRASELGSSLSQISSAISNTSATSICDPHNLSLHTASADAGPELLPDSHPP